MTPSTPGVEHLLRSSLPHPSMLPKANALNWVESAKRVAAEKDLPLRAYNKLEDSDYVDVQLGGLRNRRYRPRRRSVRGRTMPRPSAAATPGTSWTTRLPPCSRPASLREG